MRRSRGIRVLMLLPVGLGALAVFGLIVMSLWNVLVPTIFGWKPIGFWQALGLLVLCRMLFGGFGGAGRASSRSRRRERCPSMTPEERERLRQAVRARWGPAEPPPAN